MENKHIHFIGICGVAMSALAILWKKKGWQVTGSDVGFYPPVSTHLENHQIDFYPGWHPEKIGMPDLVVVGNVAGSQNPELLYVLEKNIPHLSYPELIAKYLIKENSIVCAGTYGKTSNTSLLAWILKETNINPAYMFGGISLNLPDSADDLGGDWSVVEGDEYKTSRDNPTAKFFAYRPTHLLLTAVYWDHLDVYPTEESFVEAFKKLINLIPENGLIVYATTDEKIKDFVADRKTRSVTYGKQNADYEYFDLTMNQAGLRFKIRHQENIYEIFSPVIGEYMAENICGAFAMSVEIGIAPEKIIAALSKFKGSKRRMEKRGEINGATIYDDIAHSPIKAKSVLETLKKIHSGKIITVFEPNTGNRQPAAKKIYDNAFTSADTVVIPRLTKIKVNKEDEEIIEGEELSQIISQTHPNVIYIDDDEKLINYLRESAVQGGAIAFLGSHGFRGMIESITSS